MTGETGSRYCPQCGYDLRGQMVERCPECGFHYDLPSLEFEAREAFHRCIGPYLGAVTPLLGSIALSFARFFCLGWLVILLVPCAGQRLRNWMMCEPAGQRRRKSVMWDTDGVTLALIAVLAGLRVLGWPMWSLLQVAMVPLAVALLLFGAWRSYEGSRCLRALRAIHQDRVMPRHRVLTLERAQTTCLVLFILAAIVVLVAALA